MTKNEKSQKAGFDEDIPPLFNSWKAWYSLVLIFLAVLILLFYWFTISFS